MFILEGVEGVATEGVESGSAQGRSGEFVVEVVLTEVKDVVRGQGECV